MRYIKSISFLILLSFLVVQINANDSEKAKLGSAAPNFTLTDIKGETHSLSDFKDKYVVLEWINFDCPFVKKHYNSKNMQNLQKKYTEEGVVWLSICSSAEGKQGYFDSKEISKRIADHEASMTAYLVDADGKVGKMFEAKTTPHMYVINPEGVLVYAGGIDNIKSTNVNDIGKAKNYLSLALDEAMAGKEVSKKYSQPYGCSVKYK